MVLSLMCAVAAAVFIAYAGGAAVAFVADDPAPGEGGRAASLGFFFAFGAIGYLLGEFAWRGRTALVAYRSPGWLSIDGDILTIDAPGVVAQPVDLHRSWVDEAQDAPFREWAPRATTFCPGLFGRTCMIQLRQPIGIPQALPQLCWPVDPSARPPVPSKAVEVIALDVKDRQTAAACIDRWAKEPATTTPSEPPSPIAANHTSRNRILIGCAVLVVALASTFFTLPS